MDGIDGGSDLVGPSRWASTEKVSSFLDQGGVPAGAILLGAAERASPTGAWRALRCAPTREASATAVRPLRARPASGRPAAGRDGSASAARCPPRLVNAFTIRRSVGQTSLPSVMNPSKGGCAHAQVGRTRGNLRPTAPVCRSGSINVARLRVSAVGGLAGRRWLTCARRHRRARAALAVNERQFREGEGAPASLCA